jgi:hypothetical protein
MKRRQRREFETFSLSFLDVICCGFGAVILLLVLTKFAEPVILEQTTDELEAIIVTLEQQLEEIRGETRIVNQDLESRDEQVSEVEDRVARLQGDLSRVQGQYRATSQSAQVSSIVQGRLVEARQSLTEEMKRLLADSYQRDFDDTTVGGVPVDSEYIIFIIDTSGSMFNYAWPLMVKKFEEILNVYPRVEGIQVMNDMGQYMFSRYARKWIPDSPARRKAIIDTLRSWNAFSNSSPVEGITEAIQTFWERDKRISLYVLGDEFTGRSVQDVLATVRNLNRADAQGNRRVRIHAIGFPVMFTQAENLQYTGIRFATLMRALCDENGGTFVGLTDIRP